MAKSTRIASRFVGLVLVGGLIPGACLVALAPGARQLGLSNKLTDTVALGQLSQPTRVYDSAGNVVSRLGLRDREPARLTEVPHALIDAVIVTEDKTFWTNTGVDLAGLSRAFLENLTKGRISQGGSTITQQLVKNRLTGNRRDLARKIKELILAYRVTAKYSKREILREYLDTVYFGQGSYGVRAAARRFFLTSDPGSPQPRGKQLSELTVGEAALLAGLIHNPEGDNPYVHPDLALERRAAVLKMMVAARKITQAQADIANKEPLPTVKPPSELKPTNAWADHVQAVLLADPRLGATADDRRKKVLQGGLKVYTTLDPSTQQQAEEAVQNGLGGASPGFAGALVAMDPKTGDVKAMVDSRPYSESKFNLAVDGSGRPVGSSFKVVTLATILQNGYSRNDQVDGSARCSAPGLEGDTTNFEAGGGMMTVQQATSESVNCAFVRLSTSVGMDKVVEMAQKMGMRPNVAGRQPLSEWKRVLTFSLGVISITPLEMADIAATIANGGIHQDPVFVSKVVGPDGKVIFDDAAKPGNRVLAPDVAACEASILHGPLDDPQGTASGKGIPGHDGFGKTGTSDRTVSSTFIGGTPNLASFVWHGAPDGDVPGAGFGGDRPARIWNDFMTRVLKSQPDAPFPPPGPACDSPGKLINPALGRTTVVAPTTPPQTRTTTPSAPSAPSTPPESAPSAPSPSSPQLPQPPPTTRPPVTLPGVTGPPSPNG
jgi:penicillin-binding protein 1A